MSKDCRSTFNCRNCRGRHHTSICGRSTLKMRSTSTSKGAQESHTNVSSSSFDPPTTTGSFYTSGNTPPDCEIAFEEPEGSSTVKSTARAILDSVSQRTYITDCLRNKLRLTTVGGKD